MKPTARLDVPLGDERRRAVDLIGDRWSLWLVLAIHEQEGARFTDLAAEPGLSRRVLSERLRALVDAGLVATEQYQARPARHRYVLTERGLQVRRLALALVHVTAGGSLVDDPLAGAPAPRDLDDLGITERVAAANRAAAAAPGPDVPGPDERGSHEPSSAAIEPRHPTDVLLAGDPAAAARIHADTVLALETYDARYRTTLVETLETWLACDASVSMAAARLYAHRHTIRYRLDRVKELTGLDPAATEDRERLVLGLRARRVLADTR